MESEAYSKTFDVPQITKVSSQQIIKNHDVVTDERFQDKLLGKIPLSNVNLIEKVQRDDLMKKLDHE